MNESIIQNSGIDLPEISPRAKGRSHQVIISKASKWLTGPAIVAYLAIFKMLLHMAAAANYGLFIDELYFLACGEHLAWGYVDMPPLTAFQAWLARGLFGDSILAIHLIPALIGAANVLFVGSLVRQFGGKRFAQGLAALAVAVSPAWFAIHAYLSMNSVELLLVTGCALVLARLIDTSNAKLWLIFGLLAGVGMLNKHTMLLFSFAFIVSLVLTTQRRLIWNWWFAAGGLIALIIFIPNLIWMWQHHFPHLELLANIKRNQRNVVLSPFGFMGQQILFMLPPALPVWMAGLWYFLAGNGRQRFCVFGLAYLVSLGILLASSGRTYYLLPAYPMLIAGGATAIEQWVSRAGWLWIRPAYAALVTATGAVLAPIMLPLLPPETYIQYTKTLGISQPKLETRRASALPQLFADRFGWPEMVQTVATAYRAIPVPERERTAIFAQDYGQAGAVDFYGPKLGLPKAISGHLTYWYWGPRGYTGETILVMGDRREVLEDKFQQVEKVGEVGHPYAMASQHWDLFLCRSPKGWKNLQEIWPRIKNWN